MKFHHHSGSLFSPLCEGRPVQMHLECGGVPVDFVRENFRIVVFRHQDFQLHGARFIFQAACLVCREQSYDLISPPYGNLDRDDIRKFWHDVLPRKDSMNSRCFMGLTQLQGSRIEYSRCWSDLGTCVAAKPTADFRLASSTYNAVQAARSLCPLRPEADKKRTAILAA